MQLARDPVNLWQPISSPCNRFPSLLSQKVSLNLSEVNQIQLFSSSKFFGADRVFI
jgi:hypothetical protein